jgi:SAM-dependent methyltransferase
MMSVGLIRLHCAAVSKVRNLAVGAATFLPPIERWQRSRTQTGGTDQARYCYTVWLRHLVMAARSGLNVEPRVVGELGAGDSIGTGLAALLTGAERYCSLDVVAYANHERNLVVFEDLVELFRARADLPGDDEYPDVWPHLDDYAFPATVLPPSRLDAALAPERIERIRAAVAGDDPDGMILYAAPWTDPSIIDPASLDCLFSQAVLEHVDDVDAVHEAAHRWLRPEGWASHTIDYRSHGWADEWNGHWAYSDLEWRIVRGGRPWLLNRLPYSQQLAAAKRHGFEVTADTPHDAVGGLPRSRLTARFRESLTEEDLRTEGSFLQLRRR